jgi:hypothetical protein
LPQWDCPNGIAPMELWYDRAGEPEPQPIMFN